MHVIIAEGLYDRAFVQHTVGFEALQTQNLPEWAAGITGPAERISAGQALCYDPTGNDRWVAVRCTRGPIVGRQDGHCVFAGPHRQSGHPGGGLGHVTVRLPMARHWRILRLTIGVPQVITFRAMADAHDRSLPGRPHAGTPLFGTNFISSFADSNALAAGLARVGLVVSHDLFMNDTARRFADIVLPGTAWLEELGCKMTNTHLYLMEQALAAPGATRSPADISALADRLGLADFFPWPTEEAMIDALLDHPATGHATVGAAPRVELGAARLARGASRSEVLDTFWEGGVLFATCCRTRHAAFTSVGLARHSAVPCAGAGANVNALSQLLRSWSGAPYPGQTRSGTLCMDLTYDAAARQIEDGKRSAC